MDVFTHFLVPYAAALWALGLWRNRPVELDRQEQWRHRLALAAVFGIAGAAPDLDSLTAWARHLGNLHFLQHRGFSHSLLGAPLFGLLSAGMLALVARFWRRAAWLHWRRGHVAAALLGSLTHLVLDGITYGGVPLLWPWTSHRFTLGLFGWLVIWLAPLGALAIALHLFGRLSAKRMAWAGVVVVALLMATAGVRFASMPQTEPGEELYARSSHREWMVLQEEVEGWSVRLMRDRLPEGRWQNASHLPPGSEAPVALAMDTNAYRGFLLSTFGPIVTQAQSQNGSWEVTFTAVVPHFDATHDARWTPAQPRESWGKLIVEVEGEEVRVRQWGW